MGGGAEKDGWWREWRDGVGVEGGKVGIGCGGVLVVLSENSRDLLFPSPPSLPQRRFAWVQGAPGPPFEDAFRRSGELVAKANSGHNQEQKTTGEESM